MSTSTDKYRITRTVILFILKRNKRNSRRNITDYLLCDLYENINDHFAFASCPKIWRNDAEIPRSILAHSALFILDTSTYFILLAE